MIVYTAINCKESGLLVMMRGEREVLLSAEVVVAGSMVAVWWSGQIDRKKKQEKKIYIYSFFSFHSYWGKDGGDFYKKW